MTSKMLEELGLSRPVPGTAAADPLVMIGRNALKDDATVAARLEPYVRAGGRVLILAQDPEWITRAFGWRVCPKVARRVFPVHSAMRHSPFDTLQSDDLRDWTGSSTLIEAYPEYTGDYLRGNERDQPYAGWHWGNRGGVASAAIEKPHRSGWRPLLECEFDLAYTPLMELDCGQGRLIVCTLDLEDHVDRDPAARRVALGIVDYARHAPLAPRAKTVVYLGGGAGAAWLDKIGVSYQPSTALDNDAGLLLIGSDAVLDTTALSSYLEKGGKAFFLPRSRGPRMARHYIEAGRGSVRGVVVRARVARSPRSERVGSSLALLPGHASVGPERRCGRWRGRPDWPQSDWQGHCSFLSVGPGRLSRGREDLFPLHALARHPSRRAIAGQPGGQLRCGQPDFPSGGRRWPARQPKLFGRPVWRPVGTSSDRPARWFGVAAAAQPGASPDSWLLLPRLSHRFPDGR